MDQTKRQFEAETDDLVEEILVDVDELREAASEIARRHLVDAVFRRIHRIKGSAASFGLDAVSEIAHEFETLLSSVRAGRVPVDDDLLDAFESAAIAISENLRTASLDAPPRELLDRMKSLVRKGSNTAEFFSDANLPLEISHILTSDEKQRVAQIEAEGLRLFIVTASFDMANFDDSFRSLKNTLAEHGEVIATLPSVDPQHGDKIQFRLLYASETSPQDISGATASALEDITAPSSRDMSRSTRSNFIRIDTDELDSLISNTHDLFRTTTRAIDLALTQAPGDEGELKDLDAQIRRSFLSVEKELLDLRMGSAGPVLKRAARAGRAAARLSNKKVDFRIAGENLRLDRLLCDTIRDPLIHLVRNAVDHGVETPGSFNASEAEEGKRALVFIEATTEGGQTCVRVTDNGRGVDPELVCQAARKMGIIDESTRVDLERSLRLIFRPGFTTLSSVSSVSGRGVGLDIVETAVEQAGGEVRVRSELGKGATFEMRLPVTVALMQATIVLAGGRPYCIDSKQVAQAEILDARLLERAGESLRTAVGDLPVIRLSAVLGVREAPVEAGRRIRFIIHFPFPTDEPENPEDNTNGLPQGHTGEVAQSENRRVALIVDGVQETEEVLVRSLGRHASRWPGIAGATELRNGTVALVLDLPRLLEPAEQALA